MSTAQRLLVSLTALLLCVLVSAGSFVGGVFYSNTFQISANPGTIVEVTREVVVEREVPVEVTREVEVEVTSESNQTDEAEEEQEEPVLQLTVESEPATELNANDLELFFEVWENIENDFDGDIPTEADLNYALIQGALRSLDDPYTRFLTPELAAREREAMEGSFEGIGAFVRENDEGFIEIVRPIDNQPADLAGIRSGDLIIGVDGEDIIGQTVDEVISKVRGPRGTEVELTIARPGEADPLTFVITRALIEIPVLEYRMLDNNIAYIHLTTFAAFDVEEEFEQALQELMDQNPEAIIFDLRDNPGGFLDSSVNIADLFLGESVVLYEKSNNGFYDRTFSAEDGDFAEDIPLVVLVNGGSASASELVAGALRDNGRAILIGEQTFGKGSVQQIRQLSDGSELRVTIARWYTPNDANINEEGLTPDIVIELDPEANLGEENDNQLQRAIEYILNGE